MANKVFLCGRATRDCEVREGGETKVARYVLAVDRKYSKEKETDFINCVCFGKTAEFAEKYIKKGTKIIVIGRIQTGSYTNKDGQKINTTDVVVEEHEFAESKQTSPVEEKADGDFMTISPEVRDDMTPLGIPVVPEV